MTEENRIESLLAESDTPATAETTEATPAPAPEPQQQAEPAKAEPEADDAENDENEGTEKKANNKSIPIQELKREREKRQEAERRFREATERAIRLEERFNMLQQSLQQQTQPQQPQIPDFEQDPAGHLKAKQDLVQADLERQRSEIERNRILNELGTYARASEAEFRQQNPDYLEAYQYLAKHRLEEVMAINGCTREEAQQAVNYDELQLIANAKQTGRNVAETVYNLAKQRGYAKKNVAEDATKTIERLAQGQKDSKSLSGVGGNATSRLTAESLAGMTDEQFAEVLRTNPNAVRDAMGG